MDLGATKHITFYRMAFDIYEVIILQNMHLNDYSVVQATRISSIIVEVVIEDKTKKIIIKDALHVLKLHTNLLLVSKLLLSGLLI